MGFALSGGTPLPLTPFSLFQATPRKLDRVNADVTMPYVMPPFCRCPLLLCETVKTIPFNIQITDVYATVYSRNSHTYNISICNLEDSNTISVDLCVTNSHV